MNSFSKKIFEVCCIALILFTAIMLIQTVTSRKPGCPVDHVDNINPLEITKELETNQNNEIVKTKNEKKDILIQEAQKTNGEKSSAMYGTITMITGTNSQDSQISVMFEDGRVLDCDFLDGINKREMFRTGDVLYEFVKDKLDNRTFSTCRNCSRYQ